MENTIMNYQGTHMVGEEVIKQVMDDVECGVRATLDVSVEIGTILTMTPKDGYQKKLDLICSAEDLSTKEKIQEISRAEDKYQQDLGRNAEIYKGVMWVKASVVLLVIVGGLYFSARPEGKKVLLKKAV